VHAGFLVKLGVPATDVLVEDRSRTTSENAVETQKLLALRGISKILLVTDAAHDLRADASVDDATPYPVQPSWPPPPRAHHAFIAVTSRKFAVLEKMKQIQWPETK